MKIRIICIGKLKEKYWREAVEEYRKRLTRYCKPEIIEIKDEPIPEKYSNAQKEKAISAEGERILKQLPTSGIVCTMEIGGEQLSSEAFAQKIDSYATKGTGEITFVIGGSLGLSETVIRRSHWHMSFSPMTFPHQLFRIMLLEQIYRAFKINHGETYHK